ncbi:hypothetical protein DN597_27465, partial [Enterobacter cloacae]
FGFAENTDDLFVGKTLLHGDVLMWLMKTLLTSGCTNQRGAGHNDELIKLNAMLIETKNELKDNLYDARFMIKTNQLLLEELYRTDLTTNYFCSNIYNTSYRTGTTIKHIESPRV